MSTLRDKLKQSVSDLYEEGRQILIAEMVRDNPDLKKLAEKAKTSAKVGSVLLQQSYQAWYSKALPVIRQVLPERYQEFLEQYKLEKRKDKEIDYLTYTISDYLIGLSVTRGSQEIVNPRTAFFTRFQHQLNVLLSCLSRLDSVLADMEGTLQAELFDDELSAASELLKKGHVRAAGALVGVTLERHLAAVARNHGAKIGKKDPTIAEYNDRFKADCIYDLPTWRFIQRLADIRNISVHFKDREPAKDEIQELIAGAQKILKTIF